MVGHPKVSLQRSRVQETAAPMVRESRGKMYADESGSSWEGSYATGRWTQTKLVIEQGIVLNANFNCLKHHLGHDVVHHETLGAYKDDRLLCIRPKRTNYPIVQLAFGESVTEPSVTMYICTEPPEFNYEGYSKKIEDRRQEEEDSRLRKIDDRQQVEDNKERSVPKAPNATSENDSPWNYWRRRYLPMQDLEIDFPKYAKDLAKNAEALKNKGTGKGHKGTREGTKGEQEPKGGKKGGEGKGKQEHPPKGALPKAAAHEPQEAQAHKGNPKGNSKGHNKGTKGRGRGNAWFTPQQEWFPQEWYHPQGYQEQGTW